MIVSLIYISLFPQDIEHLGLSSISSFLRKHGITVKLVRVGVDDSLETIADKIKFESDYYGFSLYSTNTKKAFEISMMLKANSPNCKVIFGGEYADVTKEFIFRDCNTVDYIVLGNGEVPLLELLQYLEKEKDISSLPNIATRYNYEEKTAYEIELKSRDWVSRDFLTECKKNLYYTANIDTSKGCYGRCSFCSNILVKYKHVWQGRDMEDVYAEIKHIDSEYGIRSFMITDSSFEDPVGHGKKRIRQFLELLLADDVRYHFWCYLRANVFEKEDKELIQMMRQAGFTNVFIGVETFNEYDLRLYNKRSTLEMNEMIVKLFRECDINVDIGFIMFNPYSDVNRIQDNYRYLNRCRSYLLSNYVSQINIHYGTQLHQMLRQDRLLTDDYSYLNTMAYRYIDSTIDAIVTFIKENIETSSIFKAEQSFTSFDRFFYNLKAQFLIETAVYEKEYDNLKNSFATVLADFFQILYEDTVEHAREAFPVFQTEMSKLYKQFNSFNIRIYRKFNKRLSSINKL